MDLQLKYIKNADGSRKLTIPDERRAWVIEFIKSNAVRPPAEIEAIVQAGHDELLEALSGLSEAQAAYKPAPEDWSVLELMAHVVTTKRGVAALSQNLGEGHLPPGFGPEFEEARTQDGITLARFDALAEARDAAQAAHDDLLGFIRGIGPTVNTEIRFKHFVFGALNSREWAVFQRIHDGDHTPHIGKIRASPAFPPP